MTAIELVLLAVAVGAILLSLYSGHRQDREETLIATFPTPLSGVQAAEIRDILGNHRPGEPIILSNGGIVYRLGDPYPNSDASG